MEAILCCRTLLFIDVSSYLVIDILVSRIISYQGYLVIEISFKIKTRISTILEQTVVISYLKRFLFIL